METEEEKWIKHYSSLHQILLVGEGDFSFSLSLALAFGTASNITASSLDSYGELIIKYKNANANLFALKFNGASILHEVDVKKIKLHPGLEKRKFDRIIYNFPHAGFHGKEHKPGVIKLHRNLACEFFRNACDMLQENGEIHVSHKTTYPFNNWKIGDLASNYALEMIECADFKIEDYPGYTNKKGTGSNYEIFNFTCYFGCCFVLCKDVICTKSFTKWMIELTSVAPLLDWTGAPSVGRVTCQFDQKLGKIFGTSRLILCRNNTLRSMPFVLLSIHYLGTNFFYS
ncbi:heavy metal-associated isoprenylated plant 41-like [Olea europaea subsp. europaea]|uniref:Heavy metal-associated isoprenylated plant 41-like n=1 Tax=Olea europaea subsp. europaea TaxID=158383 RepID=A0A8S0VJB2_OLEEU|nr:heavy metal-associated isoprenylated plant 41-like [Olea europaea subsp. europaea]